MRRPTARECKLEQEKLWHMREKVNKISRRDPRYEIKSQEMIDQAQKFGKRVAVYWRREGKYKGQVRGLEE